MPPDAKRWPTEMRLAAGLWALAVAVVCAQAVLFPRMRTLYPTYAAAGADWLASLDLYDHYHQRPDPDLDQYRYSPLVGAALAPWSCLPERLGGAVWRVVGAAAYLGAAAWWLRSGAPEALTPQRRGWWFVLLLPLALSSLQNGQVNLLVIAALLATAAASAEGRWRLAAAFMAAAAALKIYPLAVGLLLGAAYPRRFLLPLLAALVAVVGLPFLMQRPAFVAAQYASWARIMALNDGRAYWPDHMAYRDLWLLWRRAWPHHEAYQAATLALAAACAAAVLLQRRRGLAQRTVTSTALVLGTGWLCLCGPTMESSTFVLLAPALAWLVMAPGTGHVERGLGLAACALLAVCVLAGLSGQTNRIHGLGLHPLATLLFLAGAFMTALRRPRIVPPVAALPAARAA
jgi:hypothetical protein